MWLSYVKYACHAPTRIMISQAPRSWISSPLGVNILLSLCEGKESFVNNYTKIHSALKNSSLVNIRNKILISSSPTDSTRDIQNYFKETQKVNFKDDDLGNVILSWAKQYGNFKHDIVKYLTPETNCLFLNICTVKAKWQSMVDGKGPVMKIYNSFNYTEDIKYEARLLELPLQDDDMKLVIIVPNEKDTLSTLFSTLTNKGLDAAVNSIRPLFTVSAKLTPQEIQFESEMKTSIDGSKSAIQYGGIGVNENGVYAKVLTCLLTHSKKVNTSCSKEEPESTSFFFAVTFKGTAIFTGSFTPS